MLQEKAHRRNHHSASPWLNGYQGDISVSLSMTFLLLKQHMTPTQKNYFKKIQCMSVFECYWMSNPPRFRILPRRRSRPPTRGKEPLSETGRKKGVPVPKIKDFVVHLQALVLRLQIRSLKTQKCKHAFSPSGASCRAYCRSSDH